MSADVLKFAKPKLQSQVFEQVEGIPYLKRNVSSGVYYVRKSKAGRGDLFKTTGETRKGRAQVIADEMIAKWLGELPGAKRRRRIGDICDELLQTLEQQHASGERRKRTMDHDYTYLAFVKEHFGMLFADELDEDYWAEWLKTTGSKLNRTMFDVAKYVSKVLSFAFRRKYVGRKPKIHNPSQHYRKGRVFTVAEIKALLAAADEYMKIQVLLGYENGMRPGEIRGLRWDMIEWKGETAVINLPAWLVKTGPKYGYGRAFQISKNAASALAEWKKAAKAEHVFPATEHPHRGESDMQQSRRWRRMTARAGIEGACRMYDLRHSFYTVALLEKGMPIQQVSEFGGTSIGTLQRHYLHGNAQRTSVVSTAVNIDLEEP